MRVALATLTALAVAAPALGGEQSMLIVTTSEIAESSFVLEDFVEAKETRGFHVEIATEADYGKPGSRGQKRARAIRQYLKEVHEGFDFLLLIGDADPDYGDVPMMRVWPRHELPEDSCYIFPVDCRSCLSDLPYGDLTGDWDLNGNGRLGEHGLDDGAGGIDFDPELYVGRLPVYFGEVEELDRILDKTIAYMGQPEEETDYRRRILMPAAFFYFRGQTMMTEDVDGADVADWFARHRIDESAGWEYTTMFEQEGVVTSRFPSDVPLSRENLIAEWKKGYGMVFWGGHGLETTVGRVVWEEDRDGDELADDDELANPTLIQSDDSHELPVNKPAFVVGVSCEIGSAEVPGNLAHSLLANGGAVGIVASSSVTPGSGMDFTEDEGVLITETFGGDNVGAYFFTRLMDGEPAGAALGEAKLDLGTAGATDTHAGKMMLNYFGDPSLTLFDTGDGVDTEEDAGGADISCTLGPRPAAIPGAGWLTALLSLAVS